MIGYIRRVTSSVHEWLIIKESFTNYFINPNHEDIYTYPTLLFTEIKWFMKIFRS